MIGEAGELELEAQLITRYLFDEEAPAVLVHRYRDAHAFVLLESASPADRALLAFARRRPWSWRYLDAAMGLLRPTSLLRRKVLLMTAILEVSPAFARRFEPSGLGPWRLVVAACANGLASAFHIGIGALVLLAVLRSSSPR